MFIVTVVPVELFVFARVLLKDIKQHAPSTNSKFTPLAIHMESYHTPIITVVNKVMYATTRFKFIALVSIA